MKCTAHGFTWELADHQAGLFSSLQKKGDPAVEVATIILATGQLPVEMVDVKPFDAELEAWRCARYRMIHGVFPTNPYSPAQLPAMMRSPYLDDEAYPAHSLMNSIIDSPGCRLNGCSALDRLELWGWATSYHNGHDLYWTVGEGYKRHVLRMIVKAISVYGKQKHVDLCRLLEEKSTIIAEATRTGEKEGLLKYHGGRWHLAG